MLKLRCSSQKLIDEAKSLNAVLGDGFSRFKKVGKSNSVRAADLSRLNFQNAFERSNLVVKGEITNFFDNSGIHAKYPELGIKCSQLLEMLNGPLLTHENDPCRNARCVNKLRCKLTIKVNNAVYQPIINSLKQKIDN